MLSGGVGGGERGGGDSFAVRVPKNMKIKTQALATNEARVCVPCVGNVESR